MRYLLVQKITLKYARLKTTLAFFFPALFVNLKKHSQLINQL